MTSIFSFSILILLTDNKLLDPSVGLLFNEFGNLGIYYIRNNFGIQLSVSALFEMFWNLSMKIQNG